METRILIFLNGLLYEDYWVNNERCSKGRMIFVNGENYQGDLTDDKAHESIEMRKLIKIKWKY